MVIQAFIPGVPQFRVPRRFGFGGGPSRIFFRDPATSGDGYGFGIGFGDGDGDGDNHNAWCHYEGWSDGDGSGSGYGWGISGPDSVGSARDGSGNGYGFAAVTLRVLP